MVGEQRLQTWANPPGSVQAQNTYNSIKTALGQSGVSQVKGAEIYLQGSYANSTNVRVDSDIDVVVQLNSTFYYDLSNLGEIEKNLFEISFPNSSYTWSTFRNDVISALEHYYGTQYVKPGNKSIKLVNNGQRLNADIIPCLQYRKYNTFNLDKKDDFIEGMKFWTIQDNKQIINYPKVHKTNGEDKNATHRTGQSYKDLVRIIKNIRRQMVQNHNFDPKLAPSYFIECAIYNVPDPHFDPVYQRALSNLFDYYRTCDPTTFVTVSRQHYLFGVEPWQWSLNDAQVFFNGAESYFENN